ncbi:hypothetical protein [Methylopila turkensis]|uniref:hypothetical protein n=1 Tax=Methylopila turkensis TaxID=1437816 RepID=UPI0022F2E419|nr:hypothetical protein [Methylopila turkensis]
MSSTAPHDHPHHSHGGRSHGRRAHAPAPSLLRASAAARLAGAVGASALIWLAVWWVTA